MSMPRVIKHKASLKSPDLNNMIAPFSKSGLRVSRFRDSCCRVSRSLQPTETRNAELPKSLAASSSTAVSCFMTLGILEQRTPTSCLRKYRNVEPRCVQQKTGFQRNFSPIRSFGLRDFANPDARLPALQPPKPRNGQWVLTLPGNEYVPPVFSTVLGL
jgi:hypothetical protein